MDSIKEMLAGIPWWLPPAIALAGAALLVSAVRGGITSRRNIGLGVLAAAGILALLGYLVQSDTQKMEKRTKDIVAAVGDQDWTKLSGLLGADTVLGFQNAGELTPSGRDHIVGLAKSDAKAFGLQTASVSTIEASRADTIITVNVTVSAAGGMTGRGIDSNWDFEWQKSGSDWTLSKITCIRIDQSSGVQASEWLMNGIRGR